MIPLRGIPSSLRLALAALSLSAVFLGWSAYRAVNHAPVSPARKDSTPPVIAPEPSSKGRVAQISAAVDRDPFNPLRKRPAVRYRLASEMVEAAAPPQRTQLRWAGVVIAADPKQSFLSAALGTGNNVPIEILRVGDKLGEYTLKSFDSKSATFENASGEPIKIYNPIPGIR